ncbi:hypothetical protein N0V83_001789 [Neocucurbitaria cava]|uniref:Uncharacterized protein n=1 Tax=Neocucurbitaria cava TaxID=798079 RepID=A0A9W8YDC6_9PLEO|nr:hypothetical protein N0V83_001789 [Neocucurbitaria cava]
MSDFAEDNLSGTATTRSAAETAKRTTTGFQRYNGTVEKIKYFFVRRPVGHSLLHNAGLKPFSSKGRYKGANDQEIPKPELTIVASLARVISDVLRHHLVHNGVNFGMLSSPFSFLGVNFLWSQELYSATRSAIQLKSRSHFLFLILLVSCCLLAAIMGPASALLFLPSQAWLSAGSTEIFLIGTEDQLWPQHLTRNHTGLTLCERGDPGDFSCLQGGWDIIQGFVTPEGASKRLTNIDDAWTPRTMWLWRQDGEDSWAGSTLQGATVYLAERTTQNHFHAWNFAKGRQRRLRDASVSGTYERVTGRIPVVRVLCGPIRPVNNSSPLLLFPILDADRLWRVADNPGPYRALQMNGTYKSLVNATWTLLPAEFGTSTAGLAFVTNHPQGNSAGCGCSFDARWAQGHSAANSGLLVWQAFVGPSVLPNADNSEGLQRASFFQPRIKDYLGPSITSEAEWLEKLSTGYALRDSAGNFTALETLLVSTRLWDLPWVLSDSIEPYEKLE